MPKTDQPNNFLVRQQQASDANNDPARILNVYRLSASDLVYLKKLLGEVGTWGVASVNGDSGVVVLTVTLTGDVTGTGFASIDTTIADGAVTLSKMDDLDNSTVIGRISGGTGTPESVVIKTTVANPGEDTKLVSEQGIREALNSLDSITEVDSATYTIQTSDRTIAVDYTATGAVTLTLPSASSAFSSGNGKKFLIKDSGCNAGSNNITINRAGSDTITTTTTGNTSVTISTNGGHTWIQAKDSTTWITY